MGISKSNKDLAKLSDSQLCTMVRNGSDVAFEEITRRYQGLIGTISKSYSASGFDQSDFMQEGLMALLSACKNYTAGDKKASFRNYAAVCISNRFLSVLRSVSTKSAIPHTAVVPIEEMDISDCNRNNPENLLVEQESSRDFHNLIRDILSPLELNVLDCYLKGMSYTQISQKLGTSQKSVDNALQRIRRKIADNI